jgi:hypothetical protein
MSSYDSSGQHLYRPCVSPGKCQISRQCDVSFNSDDEVSAVHSLANYCATYVTALHLIQVEAFLKSDVCLIPMGLRPRGCS